jgi:hypothetical protein
MKFMTDEERAPPKPAGGAAPPDPAAPGTKPAPAAKVPELDGRGGLDPTRYGDWEKDGRCVDF